MPDGRPASAVPAPDLSTALGGKDGIRRLIRRFFDQMQRRPSARAIRAMHAADLGPIRQKLAAFLTARLEGPRPPLRPEPPSILSLAHFRLSIGTTERDEWIACMEAALRDVGAEDDAARSLLADLYELADRFRSDDDGF